MASFALPLIFALHLTLALASLLDSLNTPGAPCSSLCNTIAQDYPLICKPGNIDGMPLKECFICLKGIGDSVGKSKEYPTNFIDTVEAACAEGLRTSSLQPRTSRLFVHRRVTGGKSLPKGAIAGIAIGAAITLALALCLAYFLYRRHFRSMAKSTSGGSWKGPRRTTSSLDFRCRTRVTPLASRVDFRRLHKESAAADEKRLSAGVKPSDALGSNPVLSETLDDETPAVSPLTDEASLNGQTLCSQTHSPPYYTGSIKWASPAVPSPRTPAPAYSPQRVSPYTLPSATPSSTRSAAPLLSTRAMYTPPKYGSASPSSYHSAESAYSPLYPLGEIWEGPTRSLRTQKGRWDLHARSLEQGVDARSRGPEIGEHVEGASGDRAEAWVQREHEDVQQR